VEFANSDASMVAFFCRWLRTYVDIDETRLRVRVYLHRGLDLDAAHAFWSEVTGMAETQFQKLGDASPDHGPRAGVAILTPLDPG